jgi:HEPN domain-containing protein
VGSFCFASSGGESDQSGLPTVALWKRGDMLGLLEHLPNEKQPNDELIEKAIVLDRHYIPSRYPNGFERGAPTDYYSRKDANEAISNAEAIIEFCQNHLR